MLRLASACSSAVLPYALGAIATSRVLSGSIANAEHQHQLVRIKTISRCFSTVSPDALNKVDRKLIRVLKSEIKSFDPSEIQRRRHGDLHSEEELRENPCCYPDKRPRIQLTVNISKQNGQNMRIMLWGTVGNVGYPKVFVANKFLSPNELSFDWKEFIRVRGIDDSIAEFLMDYMDRRRDRIYLLHLKKFRQFIKD